MNPAGFRSPGLVFVLGLVAALQFVPGAAKAQQLKVEDLKQFFEGTEAKWSGASPLRITFVLKHKYLPGWNQLLKWKQEVQQTWLDRGWANDESQPIQEEYANQIRKELERIAIQIDMFNDNAKGAIVDAWFGKQGEYQVRWRELPPEFLVDEYSKKELRQLLPPEKIDADILADNFQDVRFISSLGDGNILAWPGINEKTQIYSVLKLKGMPRLSRAVLPEVGNRIQMLPFRKHEIIEEFFAIPSQHLDVRFNSTSAQVEGQWTNKKTSDLAGTWHGIRATLDLQSGGIPTEIHSFVMFDPSNKPGLPANNLAWRSYHAEVDECPEIGFYPKQVRLIRRKSPIQLVSHGKIDISNRTDGQDDQISTEEWTMEVVSVAQPDLPAGFFDYNVPDTAILVNEVTGTTRYPDSMDSQIDEESKRLKGMSNSRRSLEVILLWAFAIVILAMAGLNVRKRAGKRAGKRAEKR